MNTIILLAFTLISTHLYAQHHDHSIHSSTHTNHKLDHLAPIGIMSDHMHNKGTLMLSYRYMSMDMEGLISASDEKSEDDYFNDTNYMMAPKRMNTKMHMLGAMYAFTDKFSLMLMIPHLTKQMTMTRKMGRTQVESDSSSLGDANITSLFKLFDKDESTLILGAGLTIPTGNINHKKNDSLLPYGMQTGNGSYAFNIISTYTYKLSEWSFGAQFDLKTYLNENSNDYKKGNEYSTSLWIQRSLIQNFSTSLRLSQKNIDPLDSSESDISMMSASFSPDDQHGMRRFVYIGLSYSGFKKNRIALEYGKPIDQDLSGYQLKSEKMFTLGIQQVF